MNSLKIAVILALILIFCSSYFFFRKSEMRNSGREGMANRFNYIEYGKVEAHEIESTLTLEKEEADDLAIKVKVFLKNLSGRVLHLDKINIIKNGRPGNDYFNVTFNSEKIEYKGMVASFPPPSGPERYEDIKPGEILEQEISLLEYYPLPEDAKGELKVEYKFFPASGNLNL